jgi:hypothetical protein
MRREFNPATTPNRGLDFFRFAEAAAPSAGAEALNGGSLQCSGMAAEGQPDGQRNAAGTESWTMQDF